MHKQKTLLLILILLVSCSQSTENNTIDNSIPSESTSSFKQLTLEQEADWEVLKKKTFKNESIEYSREKVEESFNLLRNSLFAETPRHVSNLIDMAVEDHHVDYATGIVYTAIYYLISIGLDEDNPDDWARANEYEEQEFGKAWRQNNKARKINENYPDPLVE